MNYVPAIEQLEARVEEGVIGLLCMMYGQHSFHDGTEGGIWEGVIGFELLRRERYHFSFSGNGRQSHSAESTVHCSGLDCLFWR